MWKLWVSLVNPVYRKAAFMAAFCCAETGDSWIFQSMVEYGHRKRLPQRPNCKAGDAEGLDPDVAAFLRYVDGKTAEGRFVKAINDEVVRVKEHKETKVEYMTLAMELERMRRGGELIGEKRGEKRGIKIGEKQGLEKGKNIGREEGKMETARKMFHDGMSLEKIAEYTDLSLETLQKAMNGQQPA